LVVGVLVLEPVIAAGTEDVAALASTALYPVLDLVILLQLVYLWTSARRESGALRLLVAAVGTFLATDIVYQAAMYTPGLEPVVRWLDLGWMLGYVLVGAAAVDRSMVALTEHRTAASRAFSLGRVIALGAAFAALPALSLVVWVLGRPQPTAAIEVVHVVLVVIVVIRLIEVVHTIRSQREGLAHLADTDFLTGLENRRRFVDRCGELLEDPKAPRAVVLMVGLQRFTEINDTLGYRTGDELLRTVGSVLSGLAGPGGAVARLGGDVFGLLVPGLDALQGTGLAQRIRAVLVEPLAVAGMSITVDGAVGVLALPDDAPEADLVLDRADVALASAAAQHGGVARWTREAEESTGSAPRLMAELKNAIELGQVIVHFQPQVEVATGRVLGTEALVRWQHPERGLIPPADFVPAAERTGLIRLLTLVVLDRAVSQAVRWSDEGADLTVSVNLSVRNLLDPRLVDDVRASLERHGLPAGRLELEITEMMAMVDPVRAAAVLSELAGLGVVLSVDDYGTGYGSLAYLQRLPVSRLKIDRTFVTGLLDDPASAAIVQSTVALARHLGLSVVAEGVEDLDTLIALRDMRCFAAQGFALSRPVAADQLPAAVVRIESALPPALGQRVPTPRGLLAD
ncbi:MAG TPA: bifunctional diguanylate cyclase/phosphodiesterase, partial [Actinotalea sp.]|nr:bifunctional diguanylate cyclase/phosphodiesterase [Actinotalea sp.]